MIGHVKKRDGSLFLDRGTCRLSVVSPPAFGKGTVAMEKIWLLHYHFGHPLFGICRITFPTYFYDVDVSKYYV